MAKHEVPLAQPPSRPSLLCPQHSTRRSSDFSMLENSAPSVTSVPPLPKDSTTAPTTATDSGEEPHLPAHDPGCVLQAALHDFYWESSSHSLVRKGRALNVWLLSTYCMPGPVLGATQAPRVPETHPSQTSRSTMDKVGPQLPPDP